MKKFFAIVLLTIHLFNQAGAAVLCKILILKNDAIALQQIEREQYDQAELIEIKVPLNTPYYSSSTKYERYYGEIDLKGNYYNYVQRKVLNDTVYLLCLPNDIKSSLLRSGNLLHANNTDAAPVKKALASIKELNLSCEYYTQETIFIDPVFIDHVSGKRAAGTATLLEQTTDLPAEPPEQVV